MPTTWTPVPVPRPTYLMKPVVPRPEPAPLAEPVVEPEGPPQLTVVPDPVVEPDVAPVGEAEHSWADDLDMFLARRRAANG